MYNYKSDKINVKSIVLLHRSIENGTAENVFNYSNGAQVFKNSLQWEQFIKVCEEQVTIANKDTFTYTFCKQSDFDDFVPTTQTDILPVVEQTNISWSPGKMVSKDLFVDNDIKVEYIVTQDTKVGIYQATLTSTNGKDLKSETYTNSNLITLQNMLKEEAKKDFEQLKLERG
jgi:hypothetical protein